jgi:tetratricopeptide (TPR) repeat protein
MTMLKNGLVAAFLASAAIIAAPALAKDKPAAEATAKPPKLSKGVAVALQAAQKLQQAGDNQGSIAKIDEAAAVPNLTVDDVYTIASLRLNAAIGLKDNALMEKSLDAMLATDRAAPADKIKFLRAVSQLSSNRKDYPKAIGVTEQLVQLQPQDFELKATLAELYFTQKQTAKATAMLGDAIAASKAAGTAPPESWYKRRVAFAVDGKVANMIPATLRELVIAYPGPVNWRDALLITRDSFPKLDDQASLDFMRLQSATGSLNGERDFVEYADTALGKGFPGEAQSAINEGIRRNMLVASKPLVAELKRSADSKVAADKASLPGLEKDIKTSPKLALATGDAYYGYGDFAKAASLYKMAIGAAAVDQPTANLRLGMALAKAGDKAGATAAFQAVKGGAREELAQYWLIWLNQAKPA